MNVACKEQRVWLQIILLLILNYLILVGLVALLNTSTQVAVIYITIPIYPCTSDRSGCWH